MKPSKKLSRLQSLTKRISQKYLKKTPSPSQIDQTPNVNGSDNNRNPESVTLLDSASDVSNDQSQNSIMSNNFDDILDNPLGQLEPENQIDREEVITSSNIEFENNSPEYHIAREETVNSSNIEFESTFSNRVLSVMNDMQNQLVDLGKNVTLLRKQLARLELKSIGWPIGDDGKAKMANTAIEADDLINFDSLLSNEGLPLKTVVETNDFEIKLRDNPNFKSKIVSLHLYFI